MQTDVEADAIVDVLENRPDLRAADVRASAQLLRGSMSGCDRRIGALHPSTSFVVVPIFALATTGIPGSAVTDRSSCSDGRETVPSYRLPR
jgi:hypothetical protein